MQISVLTNRDTAATSQPTPSACGTHHVSNNIKAGEGKIRAENPNDLDKVITELLAEMGRDIALERADEDTTH